MARNLQTVIAAMLAEIPSTEENLRSNLDNINYEVGFIPSDTPGLDELLSFYWADTGYVLASLIPPTNRETWQQTVVNIWLTTS